MMSLYGEEWYGHSLNAFDTLICSFVSLHFLLPTAVCNIGYQIRVVDVIYFMTFLHILDHLNLSYHMYFLHTLPFNIHIFRFALLFQLE
jgi:hypothetical protein